MAVVALLFAAALPPSAWAGRAVPGGFFGMDYNGKVIDAPVGVQQEQFGKMARAGVESVRVDFYWTAAQPQSDGPIDFSASDRMVSLAAKHGMSLLPIVWAAPPWARRSASVTYSPPADPAEYARYLRALILRYGSHGTFWDEHPTLPRRPVIYWQVWNEPSLRLYWDAPGWVRGYGALLSAARAAARDADPGAHIVLAGLTGFSWNQLDSLYKNAHIHGDFDVAALQTYTGSPRHLLRAVQLFRQVLARHGDAHKPVWLTEMGWPAAKGQVSVPSYQRTIVSTDTGMARKLRKGYATLAFARASAGLRVSRAYWYSWTSPYTPSRDPGTGIFRYSGLFSYNGGNLFGRKPAYRAYVRIARQLEGCVKNWRGACR